MIDAYWYSRKKTLYKKRVLQKLKYSAILVSNTSVSESHSGKSWMEDENCGGKITNVNNNDKTTVESCH